MRLRLRCEIVLVAVMLTLASAFVWAEACSTFFIRGGSPPVFGKNYDWNVDVGLVVVNKRGVSKVAMSGKKPASWISKFGSVTFNQYGRELPSGGMNEAGLVVELMWLDDTEYPEPDSRGGLGNMQWIQYQLDNSATVDEVIESDGWIRIQPGGAAKIHYLVADADGGCATIEFIDEKLVAHTGDDLPWCVLTNNTYTSSVDYLGRFEGFGGEHGVVVDGSSLDRFVGAADMIARYDGEQGSVDFAFDILSRVAQGEYTKWSIVYDLEGSKIYFRTQANREVRSIDMSRCYFDCRTPVLVFDVNSGAAGDVTDEFVPYTYEQNLGVIKDAFRNTSFLKTIPRETLERLARYPARQECIHTPEKSGR